MIYCLGYYYICGSVEFRRVARNSSWEVYCRGAGGLTAGRQWGLGGEAPLLPKVGNLGAKPPAAGGKGAGGGDPSARRFLRLFNKNNAFLGLLIKLKFLL